MTILQPTVPTILTDQSLDGFRTRPPGLWLARRLTQTQPPFRDILPHWRFAATRMMVTVNKCDANIVMPAVAVKGRTPLLTALSTQQTTQ